MSRNLFPSTQSLGRYCFKNNCPSCNDCRVVMQDAERPVLCWKGWSTLYSSRIWRPSTAEYSGHAKAKPRRESATGGRSRCLAEPGSAQIRIYKRWTIARNPAGILHQLHANDKAHRRAALLGIFPNSLAKTISNCYIIKF